MYARSFTCDYEYKGVKFECSIRNDEAIIFAFDTRVKTVAIPSEVAYKGKTYKVKGIDFRGERILLKTEIVVIGNGIERIEKGCFSHFKDLKVVYIPNSVTYVGKDAFNTSYLPKFEMSSAIDQNLIAYGLEFRSEAKEENTEIDILADIDMGAYSDVKYDEDPVAYEEIEEEPVAVKAEPGKSDVDVAIPVTNLRRENTFCLIIANEKYQYTSEVDYAAIDGMKFREYCTKTLGIPTLNIHFKRNAKYLDIQNELAWLEKLANAYGDEADYIVYYAGHGIPGDDGSCYLLPVDGNPTTVNNGYSLKKIYDSLGALTSKSALFFIDACFSGNDRNDLSMMGSDRAAVRRIKTEEVKGNVVVFSAASNTETALPYLEKGHGMFTYFLLKKLKETKGNVTYGELSDYLKKQVSRLSIVLNNKEQNPSIFPSKKLAGSWENMKL